ncbi:apolipoprotein N-acyltransferase [Pseudoduganella guangdongensis]|uniref:apolipoprotein N-acyltransferase n=1 Tax=Pseudoduganella guangdongensis TaxID=2692179 RepID=UPI0019288A90|nr:apolipoprotein N-acyltransferase [Pseudoduganella guangdongensis]
MKILACILASAIMAAAYARGGAGWVFGFVLLAPWLVALDALQQRRSPLGTLLCAWAMSVAFSAAAFAWFGGALGRYTQLGEAAGIALLLLAAPLFQPQFLAYALARYYTRRAAGVLPALAAAASWVACEHFVPRILGDTLGYGLYPSPLLRQAADLGGAAGLTLLLLLANEGVAGAFARYRSGWRAMARPLALAALVPLGLAAYGWHALSGAGNGSGPGAAAAGKPLRMALIQANIVDYEAQRQQKGAYAFVRELLDQHFAMSHDAVTRQRAEALLWTETAYPTTFGHPKSEAGAEFDAEIRAFADAAGVPLVFGTYARDGAGEYNAAAFLEPGRGLAGFYRKTHLFPLTEYLPTWLDGAMARRWLPWAGHWLPGNGARVMPLRLADGREIPVLPLICRDDVDTELAIAGARQGAQVILAMSNDSWFGAGGQGARLHQAAAAFRSIETRLPQFRVTTNGYSAAYDAYGEVLAGAGLGSAGLVVADLPLRQPAPTLMVRWGDWVGLAAAAFLLVLAARALAAAWQGRRGAGGVRGAASAAQFPLRVFVLPPAARIAAGTARLVARAGLLAMCLAMLLNDTLRNNTLAQLRLIAVLFVLPEAIAWCLLMAFSAQASLANGRLLLARGAQRLEIDLAHLAALTPWRLPLPGPGVDLQLAGQGRWRYGLAVPDAARFAAALGQRAAVRGADLLDVYTQARLALGRWRLDHPLAKFVLLPLVLALPAFHLHQRIAYGSAFGEYYSFGLQAYLMAFGLWWAAWAIGVILGATLLRTVIEGGSLLAAALRPGQASQVRGGLQNAAHAALYLGLPAWLLWRILGA